MKTNICELKGESGELEKVLKEVEKCAAYNELDEKQTKHFRLLAEELVSMLPSLMSHATGEFWVENNGDKYKMCVTAEARLLDYEDRERIISISTAGKNAANSGIMGKVRAAADMMLFGADSRVTMPYVYTGVTDYDYVWSLCNYRTEVCDAQDNKREEWDELERSIIAKIADDVVVGIRGRSVEITVKKKFA